MEIISHHCLSIDHLGYMGVYLDTRLLLYSTKFAKHFLFQASKEKQEKKCNVGNKSILSSRMKFWHIDVTDLFLTCLQIKWDFSVGNRGLLD